MDSRGYLGALVAGFFFMLPTFIIVVFFSWLYFAYQQVPSVEAAFYGINLVVIGLIVGAAWSMGQSALAEGRGHLEFDIFGDEWSIDYLLVVLLAAAIVATATLGSPPVIQFIVAGVIAVVVYRSTWIRENLRRVTLWSIIAALVAVAYGLRDRILDLLGPSTRAALEASLVWALLVAL